eukprot:RCo002448
MKLVLSFLCTKMQLICLVRSPTFPKLCFPSFGWVVLGHLAQLPLAAAAVAASCCLAFPSLHKVVAVLWDLSVLGPLFPSPFCPFTALFMPSAPFPFGWHLPPQWDDHDARKKESENPCLSMNLATFSPAVCFPFPSFLTCSVILFHLGWSMPSTHLLSFAAPRS